ncbi:nitroreductase [Streptomyces lonarensis]|uniref:Nitroreductase n=2 Tax=Streptomyces lonarensis TaxID=700599 RepID=A0A7X6HZ44_9ACTN|nr:nitroreductase [Streptomyces lonarensis]
MHNAQPWRFRYHRAAGTLDLDADLDRAMPLADPTTRGLHLGCGAALLNLRVAAARLGLAPEVTLLPGGEPEPQRLASVRLRPAHRADGPAPPLPGVPAARTAAPAVLHPAIHARHTSRLPFTDRPVPPVVRAELVEAAALEGAELTFPGASHRQLVLDLTRDAEGYDHMDAAREAERQRWVEPAAPRTTGARTGRGRAARDGIPVGALGPPRASGAAPVRDFAGRAATAGRRPADFERNPQIALVRTRSDHPLDWLLAGQALQRVLLEATRHGLRASFATQALEWPELRWLLRDPQSGPGHVHMVLRLGYGPPGARTPRRPLREVLTIGD